MEEDLELYYFAIYKDGDEVKVKVRDTLKECLKDIEPLYVIRGIDMCDLSKKEPEVFGL